MPEIFLIILKIFRILKWKHCVQNFFVADHCNGTRVTQIEGKKSMCAQKRQDLKIKPVF